MLKELLEAISEQAVKASRPVLVGTPEPAHNYCIAKPDGSLEWFEADPAPRQHKAADLSAIVDIAKLQSNRECEEGKPSPSPAIWYSHAGVVLFLDDATRRDTVRLPLSAHPQLVTLRELVKNETSFNQKDFVRLLRIELAGCDPIRGNALVEIIRKIRFRKSDTGESVIQHAKASIGRALEAELTGSSPIPETVELSVPVFNPPRHDRRYPIKCAIEVDPAEERFQLIPLPGEIDGAVSLAEDDIGSDLGEMLGDRVPVYYGSP